MNPSRLLRRLFSLFLLHAVEDDPSGVRQTDEEIKAQMEARNTDRLRMYDEIADSNDEARAGEFEEIPDDVAQRFEHVESAEEVTGRTAPVVEKFKLKVNGKDVELTQQELIERAQKVESADQYLAEAARARKDALSFKTTPSPDASAAEDDLALVRAIQMGTEEEAVQAIRKLKSPSIRPDDFAKLIDERMTFQDASTKFQTEYSDLFQDPILRGIVLQKDAELVAQGDGRPYYERYEAVGNEVREWVGTVKKPAATETRLARKASVTQLPTAASRVATQQQEEPEESVSDVIASMAKTRGQIR